MNHGIPNEREMMGKWQWKQGKAADSPFELLSEIIRNEARECANTAADMRNMEDIRQTFRILGIALGRIADECKIAAGFEDYHESQQKKGAQQKCSTPVGKQ